MSPAKTPKWWVPENAEQKKAFESGKDDVIIALSVCKEGVCVKKCINIIAESTGSMIPFRKMGFSSFQEFLFHIDDVLEVRGSYTESNRYYLFVRESAMNEECRHIRRLVEGQANAKTNRGQVRPTVRNTKAVSSEVLLSYTPNRSIVPAGIGGFARAHHASTSRYTVPPRFRNAGMGRPSTSRFSKPTFSKPTVMRNSFTSYSTPSAPKPTVMRNCPPAQNYTASSDRKPTIVRYCPPAQDYTTLSEAQPTVVINYSPEQGHTSLSAPKPTIVRNGPVTRDYASMSPSPAQPSYNSTSSFMDRPGTFRSDSIPVTRRHVEIMIADELVERNIVSRPQPLTNEADQHRVPRNFTRSISNTVYSVGKPPHSMDQVDHSHLVLRNFPSSNSDYSPIETRNSDLARRAPVAKPPEEVHQVPRNFGYNSNFNPFKMPGYLVDDESEDREYGMFDMVSAPSKPPVQIPVPVQQINLPRPKTPPPATLARPDVHITRPYSPVHNDVMGSQVNTEDNAKTEYSNFLDSKGKQQLDECVMTTGLMGEGDAGLGVIRAGPETNEVEDDDSNTNEEDFENDTNVRPSFKFRSELECFLRWNKSIDEANRVKIDELEGMTNGISDEEGYETGMESRIHRNDDGSDEDNSDWDYPIGLGPTNIDWKEKNWQDPGLAIPLARVPLLKMTMFKLAQYQNEENFQLVSVRNTEEINKLNADMTLWYNFMKEELPEIELEDLRWNGVYAGFDITRNEWTRVQLDLKNGVYKDRVLVFNIDSGIKSRMQRCDLRYLLPKYATVARRAYLAKLYSCAVEPLPNKYTTRELGNFMNKQVGELHRACVAAQVPDTYNGVPWLVVRLLSLASLSSEIDFRKHVRITLHRLAQEVGANVPSDFRFC